ncbi:serpin family protein [Streptomyces termitum]|uniref:serpin family protein n=1 Tax=Streptomyces termitum TaxID=67368 RepID=UPI0033B9C8A3
MTGDRGVGRAGAVRELAEWALPDDPAADWAGSPAGLWTALAAVAAGARGRTAEELRGLLGTAGQEAGPAVAGMDALLAGTGGVACATSVRSRVPVYAAYRDALPGIGFGGLGPGAAAELDAWVAGATGGRIARLPAALDGGADLVLVGVTALAARWREAFARSETRPAPFTDGRGTVTEVPTMHRRLPADRAWRVGGGTVVELPCAGERAPLVRFVLGPEGAGPAAVVPSAWAEAGREPVRAGAVELALPRFTLRGRTDVLSLLASLGVTAPLRPGADFSGLSPEPLHVTEALQEAVLEVAEEGVEAAAVTQVVMTRSAVRPAPVERIAFDRPFGVVVLDAEGRLPLFTGWRAG